MSAIMHLALGVDTTMLKKYLDMLRVAVVVVSVSE